jgi:hypothetical protein
MMVLNALMDSNRKYIDMMGLNALMDSNREIYWYDGIKCSDGQ